MKHLKKFNEEYSNLSSYIRLNQSDFSQTKNKLKSIPFSSLEAKLIQDLTKSDVTPYVYHSGHKKKHRITITGDVKFIGRGLKSSPIFIIIDKHEDDWFFVFITINERADINSSDNDRSFWKCDQIGGVIDLIKNELKVEI